jgi:uncharacterized protein YcfL
MKILTCTLILTALSLLIGCAGSSVNTIENAHKSAAMRILEDARIDTDLNLADDLGVVRLNTAENAAGILRVQMEMENFTRDRITVNAKMEWYDGDAMLVETAGGGWQQYAFEPRESRSLTFTAPSREVRDFRLKVMSAE